MHTGVLNDGESLKVIQIVEIDEHKYWVSPTQKHFYFILAIVVS